MLDFMRQRATGWAVKVIFGLIIAVFVLWGVGARQTKEQNQFAVVGKQHISIQDYQDAVRQVTENYRSILGQRFDYAMLEKQIRKSAQDLVIDRAVLQQKADELGITASEKEIVEEIQKTEAFKEDGQFSKNRYVAVLKGSNLSPAQYERSVERTIVMRKTLASIKSLASMTPQDVQDFHRVKTRMIKVASQAFPASQYLGQVSSTTDEEKKFYTDNKDQFKKPETATVSIVRIGFDEFAKAVTPSDADIKDYYEENRRDYYIPRSYTLRHVFVRADKDKDGARKRIEDARKRLDTSSFEVVASKVNEDGTKAKGGLIGSVTAEMLSPKVAAAVGGMKKGDRSDIVESEYGFHLFKVDDVKDESVKSIDDVRSDLVAKVKLRKGALYAQKKAEELRKDLEARKAPGTYKVETVTVARDKAEAGTSGLPAAAGKIVFDMKEGATFAPVVQADSVVVGRVDKLDKGHYAFDEVQSRVRDGVLRQKAMELAKLRAEESIKTGAVKGAATEWFAPVSGPPASLQALEGLDKDINGLSPSHKVLGKPYKGKDGWYAVVFVDEQLKAWDAASKEAKEFAEEFLRSKRDAYYQEWMKAQRSSGIVKINESVAKGL